MKISSLTASLLAVALAATVAPAMAQNAAVVNGKAIPSAKVDALIDAAIRESGAASKKDMGKVIGLLKKSPEAGLLDFGQVSKTVQAKLPA